MCKMGPFILGAIKQIELPYPAEINPLTTPYSNLLSFIEFDIIGTLMETILPIRPPARKQKSHSLSIVMAADFTVLPFIMLTCYLEMGSATIPTRRNQIQHLCFFCSLSSSDYNVQDSDSSFAPGL